MCCLAAIELNQAELHGMWGWWDSIDADERSAWLRQEAEVREYQHRLANMAKGKLSLNQAVGRDGG